MKNIIPALLLHQKCEIFAALKPSLARLSVEGTDVRTCREFRQRLARSVYPNLIFTGLALPDATWEEIVEAAALAPAPSSVILVSPFPNDSLYLDAISHGASDFITPPFTSGELAHVVASAYQSLLNRHSGEALALGASAAN